jgi:hypothetical protein
MRGLIAKIFDCLIDFRAAEFHSRPVPVECVFGIIIRPDMIAGDDKDLFGGQISTVAAVEFCCQIETAGESLRLPPVTSVHDLTDPAAGTTARPVIVLHYDAIWHATNLSIPHKLIVNFMEALAAGDNRISLRQALEMASLKFGYFGPWKWQPAGSPEPGATQHSRPAFNAPLLAGIYSDLSRRRVDWRGHIDSPLAD